MSIDYTQIATNAQAAIDNTGTSVTVTRATVDSFDPSLGYTVPGADIVAEGAGVMTSFSLRDRENSSINEGDMRLLIGPGLSISPQQNDVVTVDSTDWRVVNAEPVNPAGTDCLYICQVRR